jgi:hypothetical protein
MDRLQQPLRHVAGAGLDARRGEAGQAAGRLRDKSNDPPSTPSPTGTLCPSRPVVEDTLHRVQVHDGAAHESPELPG